MRIVVMGTGAMGGFLGAMLARGGHDVTFVARGAQLAAIRERGLAIRSRLVGDFSVRAPVTEDPRELGPADLVLFCVKTYDLDPAAALIRPVVGPETAILTIQNGVDAADRVKGMITGGHVLAGLSWVLATVQSPGVVLHAGGDRIVFGDLDRETDERTPRIADAFRRAGVAAAVHPQIRVPLWDKFMAYCALSGLAALTRLPVGPLWECGETRELARGLMEEIAAVARASGVALPADAVEVASDHLMRLATAGPASRPSLYRDLVAGRRLEIDCLNGAVVRLGREHQVPTPLNFAVYAALKPFAGGAPVLPE